MPCYSPIEITVKSKTQKQKVPCGQCIGCRLERSRQWAVRIYHESKLYDVNSMVLLTYDDEHMWRTKKGYGTLVKSDLQDFNRKLRRKYRETKIRFFACGEYGDACRVCGLSLHQCLCQVSVPGLGRPHFHCIYLNFRPTDLVSAGNTPAGSPVYHSEHIEKLWGNGGTSITDVNFQSAAYVSRYVVKKITGKKAWNHYEGREPEFALMSRRPGIGRPFFDLYQNDMFYHRDQVTIKGKACKVPRYYDKLLEKDNPARYGAVKVEREVNSICNPVTSSQLSKRRVNKEKQISRLKRS